jgi:hypothetical protein
VIVSDAGKPFAVDERPTEPGAAILVEAIDILMGQVRGPQFKRLELNAGTDGAATKNPDAMIMALRKIENRGNLERANSAVMEMCIDNPREEAADLFATHPSIDRRVDALVRFAAGHDPGPIVLPAPEGSSDEPTRPEAQQEQITGASVGGEPVQSGAPFLPSRPPIELGGTRLPAMEEGQSTGASSGSEPPQPGKPFVPNSPLIGLDDTPPPGGEQGKSAAANPGAEPAQPGKPFLPSR